MSKNADTTKARAARRLRATEMARVAAGVYSVQELLQTPPEPLQGIDLYDVLLRVPKLGPESIRQTCERAGVWPHCKLGDLKYYEIERLKEALPQRVS